MGFEIWFLEVFGGVLGKSGTDGLLKGKLFPFKILSSIF